MKKISTLWTMVLLMMVAVGFSSCTDDDQDMAYYLNGEWQGYIYDGSESYRVSLCFEQHNDNYFATSGYGYEVDCPWMGHPSRTQFRWRVDNRYIYLDYGPEGRYVMDCSNFPTSYRVGEHMSGRIWHERTNTHVADFQLKKTYNEYDY